MSNINIKIELISVLGEITANTKCIIIYGSHSKNAGKEVSPTSDIDFMVIFKNNVNPHIISLKLEKELTKRNIRYDYCWFSEDYFFSLISNNIDLNLFHSIFFNGEILFSEKKFATQVKEHILKSNPTDTFRPTLNHRRNNINNCLKVWARNLSRILFDYICNCFYENQKIENWSNLSANKNIVCRSKELGVITKETYETFLRLASICKKSESEIDTEIITLSRELASLNCIIEDIVKDIL